MFVADCCACPDSSCLGLLKLLARSVILNSYRAWAIGTVCMDRVANMSRHWSGCAHLRQDLSQDLLRYQTLVCPQQSNAKKWAGSEWSWVPQHRRSKIVIEDDDYWIENMNHQWKKIVSVVGTMRWLWSNEIKIQIELLRFEYLISMYPTVVNQRTQRTGERCTYDEYNSEWY